MPDDETACAHMIVRRHAVGVPDPHDLTKTLVRMWWSCDECQTRFFPAPMFTARLGRLLAEFSVDTDELGLTEGSNDD